MIGWLRDKLFGKKEAGCKLPCISDPYRINRILRSKYKAGDYVVVHDVLHHYRFEIDGQDHVFGILEVIGAIDALKEAGI